jgi:hypothetical protein
MSAQDGARMAKGTADHKGVVFRLFGAGLMASVVPGVMSPADRTRFVILSLGRRPVAQGEDAAARAALELADVRAEAEALGPGLWRRMLVLAPQRWDGAFAAYGGLVQALGGDGRAGDTIGTVLAGWDLALHDGPPTEERLARAAEIARPLLDAALEAEAEGEGERCLRALLAYSIPKEHGGAVPAWDLVQRLQVDDLDASADTQALLGRLGMRVLDGERGGRGLFVRNGEDPVVNAALARTRWQHGNHRAALLMLDGAGASPGSVRVAGRKVRGVVVPAKHLPGGEG